MKEGIVMKKLLAWVGYIIFTPVTWIINLTTRACASGILSGILILYCIGLIALERYIPLPETGQLIFNLVLDIIGILFISTVMIVGCSTTGSILELIGRPFNYVQRKSAEYINKQQIGGKRSFTGFDKKKQDKIEKQTQDRLKRIVIHTNRTTKQDKLPTPQLLEWGRKQQIRKAEFKRY